MSAAHLGETIDIHAGGNDLIFPHHENEVAQSTCAHGGKLFARFWLHNGMLTFGGRKMSKSLGNTLQLHELLQQHPPELLRYMLLKAHYRQPLDWSDTTLEQARRTLDGLYGTLRDLADVAADPGPAPDGLLAALTDDLNTPEALAMLARLADETRKSTNPQDKKAAKAALLGAGKFLGLLQNDPEQWFKSRQNSANVQLSSLRAYGGDLPFEQYVDRLIAERDVARNSKNFSRADQIRDELRRLGVAIEDSTGKSRWKVVGA
jgi:cysteinyl-tRNA synthetase